MSPLRTLACLLPLVAGCKAPAAPPPPLAPPLAPPIPTAAVPASVYMAYPDTYVVMLCLDLDGDNFLCWPPPAGTVTVK